MSDNYLGSIGGVKPEISATTVQAAQAAQSVQQVQAVQQNQIQQGAQSQQINAKTQNAEKTNQPSNINEKPAKETKETQSKKSNLYNTSLRFKVDNETNEVTLLIVDKASEKVIRTIPPEAIKDIPPGELFQYSL